MQSYKNSLFSKSTLFFTDYYVIYDCYFVYYSAGYQNTLCVKGFLITFLLRYIGCINC